MDLALKGPRSEPDRIVEHESSSLRPDGSAVRSAASVWSFRNSELLEPVAIQSTTAKQSRYSNSSIRNSWIHRWSGFHGGYLDLDLLYLDDAEDRFSTKIPVQMESMSKVAKENFDYCASVKYCSICGLLAAFGASCVLISIGIDQISHPKQFVPLWLQGTMSQIGLISSVFYDRQRIYFAGHRALPMEYAASLILPLLLNYALTTVLDFSTFIQSTTQRWALMREGKLQFHSNARLFSYASQHWPNSWPVNIISGCSLAFTYGTLAVITSQIQVYGWSDGGDGITTQPYTGPTYGMDFDGMAMTILGLCIFIQVLISSACLLWKPEIVQTWSLNCFVTARAYWQDNSQTRNTDTFCSMRTLTNDTQIRKKSHYLKGFSSSYATSTSKNSHQASQSYDDDDDSKRLSARAAVPAVRYVVFILWISTLLFCAAAITVGVIAARLQIYGMHPTSDEWVQSSCLGDDSYSYWTCYGRLQQRYIGSKQSKNYETYTILIQSLAQAPITFVLQYAEVLFDVIYDEMLWRRATHAQGAPVSEPFVKSALTNWPRILLFIFKGLLQWVYSNFIVVDEYVTLSLIPLLALAGLFFILSAVAEMLSRWRPKGTQPAAWGNLEILGKEMERIGAMSGDVVYWHDHFSRGE